ncbi:HD domain-containing protein [Arcobacter sp.]|uniref:HD domain-containing protein n=1 Tax=Arcobacter sp. TaxID=1872629 RepID=UPI003D0EB684
MKIKNNVNNKLNFIRLFYFESVQSEETFKLINELKKERLFQKIIDSKTFTRLKNISFLGAIDYLYTNKKKHTRYDHTLSVAALALKYAKLTNLNEHDKNYLVCAALLHDIGHGPLSHSMEPSFKKIFNLSHHQAGINIINGESPLGTELYNILNQNEININKLVELLNGNSKEDYAFALDNPINIDTIDGIIRTYTYICNSRNKNKTLMAVPTTFEVLEAVLDPSKSAILDKFWELKDKVYRQIINSSLHIYADNFSQSFIEKNSQNISKNDFYLHDIDFKKQHKILFENLYNLKKQKDKFYGKDLEFVKREYKINNSIEVNEVNDILKKYVHTKSREIFSINKSKSENSYQKKFSY